MSTTMKRYILLIATALMAVSISAADLTGKRIYINPGHGSFGPNDRPMATIPYPALSSTGMPDTCGFYESNTDLWKCLYLGKKLEAAGATVLYSRTECGPWPYEKVNGQYPDYTNENYKALPDYTKYNRNLSEICEEVDANNIDYFISVHSNAATDGTNTNYPLVIYRGYDDKTKTTEDGANTYVEGSREKAEAIWAHRFGIMASGIDPASYYSMTNMNVRGDISFYNSSSTRTDKTHQGVTYKGYLGVLKHGASGFLVEGYFHTYQPARHRALNHDYCHQEGLAYYRGIVDYYGADKETTGYIMGTVKDLHRKMSNPLFNYAPKTNDQWIPCNGAEVTLLKGGVEVAKYNVDTLYNGIFVFENLTPGDDYTLDATCKGYYPLTDDQKVKFSVKANETTYQMIYLSDTSYVPPTVTYYNYPEPKQPAYLQLAGTYEMKQSFVGKKLADVLADKTIRRVLYRNGNMYVLAVDAAKEPTLIEVDAEKQTVLHTLPTDFCSVVSADGYKLSDITFTADGYLVGCNLEAVTFTPANKWNIYKWENDATGWKGALWFDNTNNEAAGNYYNAMVGSTLAYSGTTEDGMIAATTYTTGAETHSVRFVIYTVYENNYAGALRNQPAGITLADYGHEVQMVVSPRDDKSFIFSSPNKNAIEWQVVNTTKSEPKIMGTLPFHTHVANYFKYAHRDVMVAPAEDAEGKNVGVALYDITDGLDKAALIKTTNTALDTIDVTYAMAAGAVKDADITLYLVRDSLISKFTTVGVDQPATAAIMAYNLNVVENGDNYTFTFNANSDAVSANLIFYAADNTEVGAIELANVVKGANSFTIAKNELPGEAGTTMTWAVELQGQSISNIGKLYEDKSLIATSTSRLFNAVNNNPESDKFGYIYVFHRAGSSTSSLKVNSGVFEYDADYNKLNTEKYNGGETFGNPTRISLDNEGYLYIADWSDNHSGVFVANTADLSKPFTQFFQGTRDGSGVFTNNGAVVGSSTPGCHVFGHGADTKLLVYNEDASGTLPKNGAVVYNIGQADGSILRAWGEAPSAVYTLTGQGNTEGNVWGTSHGFFVSQHRAEGGNNGSATSLKFYDFNGEAQFSSASDDYKEIITGSNGSGYAVSADESMLVLQGGSSQFYVFDITWEGDKPVLTLRYEYKHGVSVFRQMNFDYAGNLVCTGDNGMYIFSLPGENITTIPARKALKVTKTDTTIHPESVTLDQTETTIHVQETMTLTATVLPENATDKSVTWSSSDEAIAIVSEGVVTAVAEGTATITVTTTDGGLTATCAVTVKLTDGVLNIRILDVDAPMYDVMGRQVDKTYKGIVIQNGNKYLLR